MRITKITQHIGVLERRATYLQSRLDSGRLEDAAAGFEARELRAIRAGVEALTRVRHYERPETSPALALEGLLDALDDDGSPGRHGAQVHVAIARANAVIAMLSDVLGDEEEADEQ